MLSLTTRSNGGKAELLFDCDKDGMYFTVLIENNQYDFEITPDEWVNLKTFLEGAKNTEQANQPDSQYDLGGLILPGSM